jgi:outer membrane protein assembly factor BamD
MRRSPASPFLAAVLSSGLLAGLAAGCGSSRVSITGEIRYGTTAEENFAAGNEEAEAERFDEASKLYEYVKTKFPFSKQAPLAELRLADLKFRQENFAEAATAYQSFCTLHPTHEQVDYAKFRVGLAQFRDAPSDFVLFPPPHEKDQRQLREAAKSLDAFLAAYPKSTHVTEAQGIRAQVAGRLAEHEWYAADFYASRGKWGGAAGRLETLIAQYPGSPREVEAYFKLADAYQRMGERFRAQQTLQKLIAHHPEDARRAEAERLLDGLK